MLANIIQTEKQLDEFKTGNIGRLVTTVPWTTAPNLVQLAPLGPPQKGRYPPGVDGKPQKAIQFKRENRSSNNRNITNNGGSPAGANGVNVVINYQGRQVTHEQKIERATQNYLMILRQLETARGTDNEERIQTLVTNSFNRLNTLLASDPANNDMMMML